jgi:hypothetical protein
MKSDSIATNTTPLDVAAYIHHMVQLLDYSSTTNVTEEPRRVGCGIDPQEN